MDWTEGHCPNTECSNNVVIFEIDEETLYCPKCGTKLEPDSGEPE